MPPIFKLKLRYTLPTALLALSVTIYQRRHSTTMAHLSAVHAANSAFSPSYLPVAVVVGGTSGIGQGFAEVFANHTKGNAHIILIGRNRTAAERIINSFPKPTNPKAKHEFIECDATLMANVQQASAEVLRSVPDGKVNFLFMSPGYFTTKGRDETSEGIDRKLAVHYYARWKFTRELIRALEKAKEQGEDAKVMSVLNAGKGGPIDLNDLGLKKTFTIRKISKEGPNYNNLFMEEFALRYPTLTFIHAFPGFVKSNIFSSAQTSAILRYSMVGLATVFSGLGFSPRDCGEYMMYGMLSTAKTPGAWRIIQTGLNYTGEKYLGTTEERKKLWDHTAEITEVKSFP